MFDIGSVEMLVIVVVLIVVVGPKDLPKVMRMAGQWAAKARRMAAEFQNSMTELAHEADLDDVQREIKEFSNTNVTKILDESVDPTGQMAEDMKVELPDMNEKPGPGSPGGDPENPTDLMEEAAKTKPEPAPPSETSEPQEPPAEPDKKSEG
jgi:sec-independent protein translocase protein TatB